MTKVKLKNKKDLEDLIKEIKQDEETELAFASEETPSSYPCVAIHHHSVDVDFGSVYNIEFVYPSDFN